MAVPTSITDCNATAANNSPAGTDSIGTSLDDYLRAHAAIIRQVSDDTIHLAGGTVTGQIKGITPVAAADLARKDYVDTMLPKAGGTVTGQIKGITPVANEDLARKDYVDSAVSVVNTSSGTYTPTFSNYTNVSSSSVNGVWSYMKVGNVVSVSGQLTVTPTSSGVLTSFYITLPVASALSSYNQASGHVNARNSGGRVVGDVVGDSSGDRAWASYIQVANTNLMDVVVSFMYQVI